MTGFIGGSGVSQIVASIAGGMIGGASSALSDVIQGKPFNLEKFFVSVALGAFVGYIGGSGVNNIKGLAEKLFKNSGNQFAIAVAAFLKNASNPSYLLPAMNSMFRWAMDWYAGGTIFSGWYNSFRGF